jgi:hypothetical protein
MVVFRMKYLFRNVERGNTTWTIVRLAYYLVWHDDKPVVFTTYLPIYHHVYENITRKLFDFTNNLPHILC